MQVTGKAAAVLLTGRGGMFSFFVVYTVTQFFYNCLDKINEVIWFLFCFTSYCQDHRVV